MTRFERFEVVMTVTTFILEVVGVFALLLSAIMFISPDLFFGAANYDSVIGAAVKAVKTEVIFEFAAACGIAGLVSSVFAVVIIPIIETIVEIFDARNRKKISKRTGA